MIIKSKKGEIVFVARISVGGVFGYRDDEGKKVYMREYYFDTINTKKDIDWLYPYCYAGDNLGVYLQLVKIIPEYDVENINKLEKEFIDLYKNKYLPFLKKSYSKLCEIKPLHSLTEEVEYLQKKLIEDSEVEENAEENT